MRPYSRHRSVTLRIHLSRSERKPGATGMISLCVFASSVCHSCQSAGPISSWRISSGSPCPASRRNVIVASPTSILRSSHPAMADRILVLSDPTACGGKGTPDPAPGIDAVDVQETYNVRHSTKQPVTRGSSGSGAPFPDVHLSLFRRSWRSFRVPSVCNCRDRRKKPRAVLVSPPEYSVLKLHAIEKPFRMANLADIPRLTGETQSRSLRNVYAGNPRVSPFRMQMNSLNKIDASISFTGL